MGGPSSLNELTVNNKNKNNFTIFTELPHFSLNTSISKEGKFLDAKLNLTLKKHRLQTLLFNERLKINNWRPVRQNDVIAEIIKTRTV